MVGSFLLFSHNPVTNLDQSSHMWASHWLTDPLEREPQLAREDLDGRWSGGPRSRQPRWASALLLLPQTELLMWDSSFSLTLVSQSKALLCL